MGNYVYLADGVCIPINISTDNIRSVALPNEDNQLVDWYVAKDIANAVCPQYKAYQNIVHRHVDKDEFTSMICDTSNGRHSTLFVTESGAQQIRNYLSRITNAQDDTQEDSQPEPEGNKKSQLINLNLVKKVQGKGHKIWYCAIDVCRLLGFANTKETVDRYVKPEDCCKMHFNYKGFGRRKVLGITKQGVDDLERARSKWIEKVRKITFFRSGGKITTPEVPAIELTWNARKHDVRSWEWLPKNTENVDLDHRLYTSNSVAMYYTLGSRLLLAGKSIDETLSLPPANYIEEFYAPLHHIDIRRAFDDKGYLVDYPLEWQKAYKSEQDLHPIVPLQHRFTLDLLMSDYLQTIKELANKGKRDPSKNWDIEFEFRLAEWFAGFYFTVPVDQIPATSARLIFSTWSKKILESLCYLMSKGIIQPVQVLGMTGDEESKPAYAYTYRFNFKKYIRTALCRDLQEGVFPLKAKVPPVLGQMLKGGNGRFPYKYVCNKLLLLALQKDTNNTSMQLNVENGVINLTAKQYCALLQVPTFASYHLRNKNLRVLNSNTELWFNHYVKGVVEAYGLFQVVGFKWSDEDVVGIGREAYPSNARIKIKLLCID